MREWMRMSLLSVMLRVGPRRRLILLCQESRVQELAGTELERFDNFPVSFRNNKKNFSKKNTIKH